MLPSAPLARELQLVPLVPPSDLRSPPVDDSKREIDRDETEIIHAAPDTRVPVRPPPVAIRPLAQRAPWTRGTPHAPAHQDAHADFPTIVLPAGSSPPRAPSMASASQTSDDDGNDGNERTIARPSPLSRDHLTMRPPASSRPTLAVQAPVFEAEEHTAIARVSPALRARMMRTDPPPAPGPTSEAQASWPEPPWPKDVAWAAPAFAPTEADLTPMTALGTTPSSPPVDLPSFHSLSPLVFPNDLSSSRPPPRMARPTKTPSKYRSAALTWSGAVIALSAMSVSVAARTSLSTREGRDPSVAAGRARAEIAPAAEPVSRGPDAGVDSGLVETSLGADTPR